MSSTLIFIGGYAVGMAITITVVLLGSLMHRRNHPPQGDLDL